MMEWRRCCPHALPSRQCTVTLCTLCHFVCPLCTLCHFVYPLCTTLCTTLCTVHSDTVYYLFMQCVCAVWHFVCQLCSVTVQCAVSVQYPLCTVTLCVSTVLCAVCSVTPTDWSHIPQTHNALNWVACLGSIAIYWVKITALGASALLSYSSKTPPTQSKLHCQN